MSELISVIIPVYKTERYLKRCVDSITRQDYSNLELILVDDGSPDNSGKLCDELAKNDNRIKVVHKKNGGLSSARNTGLELSTGEYICFVDSDDYVEKDYVSTMYHLLKKHDADLVKINYIETERENYSEKEKKISEVLYEGKQVESAFLDLKVDSVCVFLYRKALIGEIRFPVGKTSEDIPFNFQIFQRANRFVYYPANKYYYFHNPDSISNGPIDKNYFNYLFFREQIFDYYFSKSDYDLTEKAEALYARAAMGMMARMALFGLTSDLDEEETKKMLSCVFASHSKAFFKDSGTQLSRKALAVLVFRFYPLVKLMGRFIKK